MLPRPCIVFVILLAGCPLLWGCSKKPASPPPDPCRGGSQADFEILELVLQDALGYFGAEDSDTTPAPKFRRVYVSETTEGGLHKATINSDIINTKASISLDIIQSLLRRNPKGTKYSLKAYRPRDSRIVMKKLDESTKTIEQFYDEMSKSPTIIVPSLPGYSLDCNTAVIRFHFEGADYHSSSGMYILKRVNNEWRIEKRFIMLHN
jgi:hypothetical protein